MPRRAVNPSHCQPLTHCRPTFGDAVPRRRPSTVNTAITSPTPVGHPSNVICLHTDNGSSHCQPPATLPTISKILGLGQSRQCHPRVGVSLSIFKKASYLSLCWRWQNGWTAGPLHRWIKPACFFPHLPRALTIDSTTTTRVNLLFTFLNQDLDFNLCVPVPRPR
jgi:hypothetical protein